VTERREVVMSVVLSLVTCGIYGLYWIYKINEDLYRLSGEQGNPVLDVVLCCVTCGVYPIYMSYKWGERCDNIRRKYNQPPKNQSTLLLILPFVGLIIVSCAIVQGDLNEELSKYGQAS